MGLKSINTNLTTMITYKASIRTENLMTTSITPFPGLVSLGDSFNADWSAIILETCPLLDFFCCSKILGVLDECMLPVAKFVGSPGENAAAVGSHTNRITVRIVLVILWLSSVASPVRCRCSFRRLHCWYITVGFLFSFVVSLVGRSQ